MSNQYIIHIDDETEEFRVWKNGKELPFDLCQNIKWGVEHALATIKRTESEVERRSEHVRIG